MTIYGMLHPSANADRLYLPRGRGGRGLISVEDCVRAEENGLVNYVQTCTNKPLLVSVKNEGLPMNEEAETPKQLKERKKSDRLEGWKNKPLHGQFPRQAHDVTGKVSWDWLNKSGLKNEIEGLITAAQDQALRTNAIKAGIEKQDLSPLCRMCRANDETTHHLVCECSKLAHIEYKQ